MRMKAVALIFILTSFLLSGEVLGGSVRDANTYMDSVLNQYCVPDLRSIDPKPMPDFKTNFRTSFNVKADYSRGSLSGLSTIKRLGDCKTPYWNLGNATLNCTLTFDRLNLKYDLHGKYGSMPSVNNAVAHGDIKNSNVFVEVTTSQNRNLPSLRQFQVRSMSVTPSFDNLGTLRFPKDTLGKTFAGNSSVYVIDTLNNEFQRMLAACVSKLTMPFP